VCILGCPLSLESVLRFLLAAILLGSAAAKLAAGRPARDALRTYGVTHARARAGLWAALIATEAGLAMAVAAGVTGSAEAAAAVLAAFALALVAAIAGGRAGAPCGCLGGRSRIGWSGVARTALLAAAFAALPLLPGTKPATQTWLAVGLCVALAAVAALAVALLALAREVGELRLAVAPQAALSLEHEGPELGGRLGLIERFDRRAPLALAVFTSPGCSLCRALAPSLRLIANDPEVELELFDEEADEEVWRSLAIPGSPYAVVLGADGEALAKGTFNTLLQLEGLLADATRTVRA
jgi:hypothetical protein